MQEPTSDLWETIDDLILEERMVYAIKTYRERTGTSLNAANETVEDRKRILQQRYPERFKTEEQLWTQACDSLRAIKARIVICEGFWGSDSSGWFIVLCAITEEPSQQHPKYTSYDLYAVKYCKDQVEQAIAMGTELANTAGVDFYLTDTNSDYPDDRKRWWDDPVANSR